MACAGAVGCPCAVSPVQWIRRSSAAKPSPPRRRPACGSCATRGFPPPTAWMGERRRHGCSGVVFPAGPSLLKVCFEGFLDGLEHVAVVFFGPGQGVPLVHVLNQVLNRRVEALPKCAGVQCLDLDRAVRVQALAQALFPEALEVAVRGVRSCATRRPERTSSAVTAICRKSRSMPLLPYRSIRSTTEPGMDRPLGPQSQTFLQGAASVRFKVTKLRSDQDDHSACNTCGARSLVEGAGGCPGSDRPRSRPPCLNIR